MKAEAFLAATAISQSSKVRDLSKGMVTQLHLALVMAVDARLLVLDEPTLGLDLVYRKAFYDSLINDYFDGSRTILISTHQVDEIEHILTDVVVLGGGRVALDCGMEELETRYLELTTSPDHLAAARALGPLSERQLLGRATLLFDGRGLDRGQLIQLGEVRMPSLAELFIALAGDQTGRAAA
jgi:ABC-2 type transport system ATP-binding protein